MTLWRRFRWWVHRLKHLFIILLTPLVLLPLPICVGTMQAKAAFTVIVMAVYWTMEVLPISITSLLPVILFPLLDVLKSDQVCRQYLKDIVMLFIGGLMFAVGIEKWKVHERIALFVLVKVGTNTRALLFGFMAVTAFLSMWISNTATTAMMVPIAHAVLRSLREEEEKGRERKGESSRENRERESGHKGRESQTDGGVGNSMQKEELRLEPASLERYRVNSETASEVTGPRASQSDADDIPGSLDSGLPIVVECFENEKDEALERAVTETLPPSPREKMMMLSICYAANIGGMATLTGTGPNTIFKGQIDTLFPNNTVSFATWFFFACPVSVLCLVAAWLWLQIRWLGLRSLFSRHRDNDETRIERSRVAGVVRAKYEALGPVSYAEKSVLVMFACMAMLWLFRSPGFIVGWGDLLGLGDKTVTDATVAVFMSTLLFVLPSENLIVSKFDDSSSHPPKPYSPLLDWHTTLHNLPWGIVLLLGGGFALAEGCKVSCLSYWLGQQFSIFSSVPEVLFLFILVIIAALTTEFTSNSSTATIFMPILVSLADSIGVNPLKLTMPVILATSFAFMLPVATAPNAIVFSYGQLKITDMITTGIVMNVICIFVVLFGVETWGDAIFHLNSMPEWITTNGTIEGSRCAQL